MQHPGAVGLLAGLLILAAVLSTGDARSQESELVRQLHAPAIVDPRSDKLVLRCEYDLRGKPFYSISWYKNDEQLFRYAPSLTPPKLVTDLVKELGLKVDLRTSDSERLELIGDEDVGKNMHSYEGTYLCEVMADAPSYHTGIAEANVSVAILPQESPAIEGIAHNYQVGELLEATCVSQPSLPPAELTFYLNNRKVDRKHTRDGRNASTAPGVPTPSRLSLSVRLERKDFPGGSLSLGCRATLPGLAQTREWKTARSATLAASNQRLAQEPPRRSAAASSRPTWTSALLLPTLLPLVFLARQGF